LIEELSEEYVTLERFAMIKPDPKSVKETLISCLRGMKRKAHGTQKPRHINRIVEVTSTAQRSDSLAQTIIQSFSKAYDKAYENYLKYLGVLSPLYK